MPETIPLALVQYSVLFVVKSEIFGDSTELYNILRGVEYVERLEVLALEGAIDGYSTYLIDSDMDIVVSVSNDELYSLIEGATDVA